MARMNTDHVSRLQLRHPRARMGYVSAPWTVSWSRTAVTWASSLPKFNAMQLPTQHIGGAVHPMSWR